MKQGVGVHRFFILSCQITNAPYSSTTDAIQRQQMNHKNVMSKESCKFVIAFPLPMIIYLFHVAQSQSLRTSWGSLFRTPPSKRGNTVIISVSQLDIFWHFLFCYWCTRINGSCTGIIIWKFNFEALCDFINCLNPATVILRR